MNTPTEAKPRATVPRSVHLTASRAAGRGESARAVGAARPGHAIPFFRHSETMNNLNITVMLGGPSAEREVSLRSGEQVANALRSLGHQVHELDPVKANWKLPRGTDVVFLALHGTYGEDGTAQGLLEELEVPYTGCDPEASRIGFDKALTKQRCVAAGVPTARFALIDSAAASWPLG